MKWRRDAAEGKAATTRNGYDKRVNFKYREQLDALFERSCETDLESVRFRRLARNIAKRVSTDPVVNKYALLVRFVIEAEERPPWVVLRTAPPPEDHEGRAPA